jgi:hypothetical protein
VQVFAARVADNVLSHFFAHDLFRNSAPSARWRFQAFFAASAFDEGLRQRAEENKNLVVAGGCSVFSWARIHEESFSQVYFVNYVTEQKNQASSRLSVRRVGAEVARLRNLALGR